MVVNALFIVALFSFRSHQLVVNELIRLRADSEIAPEGTIEGEDPENDRQRRPKCRYRATRHRWARRGDLMAPALMPPTLFEATEKFAPFSSFAPVEFFGASSLWF